MIQSTSLSAELWFSLFVIAFIIGMAIFIFGWVKRQMKKDAGE